MESTNNSHIVDTAKTWISSQTGMSASGLHVFQFERKGSDYEVGIEGNDANTLKRYVVTVNDSGTVISHREAYAANRGSGDSTLITIAFVFSILSLIASGFYFVIMLGLLFAPGIPAFALFALIPLVFFVVGLYCFTRINRIRHFISDGKDHEAYNENTIGFGILALIFNGIITGILLLVARSSMRPN